MKMYNPPHPGEVLKELCIEPLNLTVTEAAEALGVSRKTLSAILNGRAGISPEMAIRLGKAFDTSAESWLNQQMQYDLWQAEQDSWHLRGAQTEGSIISASRPPEGISRPKVVTLISVVRRTRTNSVFDKFDRIARIILCPQKNR